jgi:hypothetical protein
MTSFYSYINYSAIKLPIYYASHRSIVGQIPAINPELFHVFIHNCWKYIHLKSSWKNDCTHEGLLEFATR